jgi:hypothetical protein
MGHTDQRLQKLPEKYFPVGIMDIYWQQTLQSLFSFKTDTKQLFDVSLARDDRSI